jgi:hypothetical protein
VLWIRITLMRIRTLIRIIIFILCGSGFLFYADADPDATFHPDADLDEILASK